MKTDRFYAIKGPVGKGYVIMCADTHGSFTSVDRKKDVKPMVELLQRAYDRGRQRVQQDLRNILNVPENDGDWI